MSEQLIAFLIPQVFMVAVLIISEYFKRKNFDYDDIPDIESLEVLERKIKEFSEILYPIKTCEYCNVNYEMGENYCQLCGTGLKEEQINDPNIRIRENDKTQE